MRARPRFLRRAGQAACLWLLAGAVAAQMGPDDIGHWHPPENGGELLSAEFLEPTTRYAHAVLGDAIEWGALVVRFDGPEGAAAWAKEFALPKDHVFEDLQPRLVDLDLDGRPDAAMVVETDMRLGAALALYGASSKIADTPHIGTRNRWLAPIGAADLDGDGYAEIAYIDRPHLAKTLRIWRLKDGKLAEVASKPGLTNHRIGQDFITSGIRDCGDGPEIITLSGDWRRIVASRLTDGELSTKDIGAYREETGLAAALACR